MLIDWLCDGRERGAREGTKVFGLSNWVSSDAIYRGGVIKVGKVWDANQGTDFERVKFEMSVLLPSGH